MLCRVKQAMPKGFTVDIDTTLAADWARLDLASAVNCKRNRPRASACRGLASMDRYRRHAAHRW